MPSFHPSILLGGVVTQVKVVFSTGDVRLELEGDQAFVEANLEKLLPMVRPSNDGGAAAKGDNGAGTVGAETHTAEVARQTLKNFFKSKSPGNAYEAIAVVMQYKRQHEQKDELSANEIRAALIQAGHRPSENMAQAL